MDRGSRSGRQVTLTELRKLAKSKGQRVDLYKVCGKWWRVFTYNDDKSWHTKPGAEGQHKLRSVAIDMVALGLEAMP